MTGSPRTVVGRPEAEVLISADGHAAEPDELWGDVPSSLCAHRPALESERLAKIPSRNRVRLYGLDPSSQHPNLSA